MTLPAAPHYSARAMATKRRGRGEGILNWLYARGEETLAEVVQDLIRNRALTDTVVQAVRRAAEAKGQIDRNMQALLGLLNVPTRADYQKLLAKIEALQGNLVNVNMKLDRLLAAQHRRPARHAPPASGPGPSSAQEQ